MIEFRGPGFTIIVPQSSLSPNEDNVDVLVRTLDGRHYTGTVYTPQSIAALMDKAGEAGDEMGRDYFFDPSMVIVRAISGPVLVATVADLLRKGVLDRIFIQSLSPHDET